MKQLRRFGEWVRVRRISLANKWWAIFPTTAVISAFAVSVAEVMTAWFGADWGFWIAQGIILALAPIVLAVVVQWQEDRGRR